MSSVIDYFLVPIFVFAFCIMVLSSAYEDGLGTADNLFVIFYFLIFGAFAFETGYKNYFRAGRAKYFYVIFVAAPAITALTYLVAFIVESYY